MRPEPNFPVRPDEFVGRSHHIEAFREALQQGLTAGRTSSFAILGDWGIGKILNFTPYRDLGGQTAIIVISHHLIRTPFPFLTFPGLLRFSASTSLQN